MYPVALRVTVEILDHDHGHWCRDCKLATGVRAWITRQIGTSLTMWIQLHCPDCGSRDIVVADDAHHC